MAALFLIALAEIRMRHFMIKPNSDDRKKETAIEQPTCGR